MTRTRTSATIAALGLSILMSACNGQTGGGGNVSPTPTTPTTLLPPTNPSPAAPRGEITVRSQTPASPASLIVRECTYPNTTYTEMCSTQLKVAFDVQFQNEISNAVLTASFYAGSQQCGFAGSASRPFAAGGRETFTMSEISFSDDATRLLCPLPAVTMRMVVQLWEVSRPSEALLTQEFVNTYTFVEP
jgi:hypothetical protein